MNNLITLNAPANASVKVTKMEYQDPLKDARALSAATARIADEEVVGAHDWRLERLQRDWRMLAGEWQALAGAIEQFEREFDWLEENLDRRWERRAGINGGTRLTRAPVQFCSQMTPSNKPHAA